MLLKQLLFLIFIDFGHSLRDPIQEYLDARRDLLSEEVFLGSELTLNGPELIANASLMVYKLRELSRGTTFPKSFSPSKSFLTERNAIKGSPVFQFIRSLPKGGALHTHDLSLVSASWVVFNITYRDHLYVTGYPDVPHFQWRSSTPFEEGRNWTLMSSLRSSLSESTVNKWLLQHLDIRVKDPEKTYADIDEVWDAFMGVMIAVQELISYAPIYDDYMYRGLYEFMRDGVSYIEIRTVFPETICRDLICSKSLSTLGVARLNKRTIQRFLRGLSGFCGVSLIYAPVRGVSPRTVQMKYLNRLRKLRHFLPGLVRGFDLVGQEDKGQPLLSFIATLLKMKKMDPELAFVFHAGETNWEGGSTDLNLLDALLLNTTRIGHGYALTKHPLLKRLAKEKNTALEICPISNQVLGLVKDLRNHPGSSLFAEADLPIVISSDDPGSWGAKGLSYDLYEAFMGLAGKRMDLRLLKKLIWNSIEYSLLGTKEKNKCRTKLEYKWDALFVKQIRQ
uniref:Adenosine deaminase n=1 Tax=Caligus rogercresseyi TaxID=217165 RepID=C1BNI3_CALRO|nr:Cat eye syndrome critical region protein 1 homolog precursor [Caligus rogercresseyi]